MDVDPESPAPIITPLLALWKQTSSTAIKTPEIATKALPPPSFTLVSQVPAPNAMAVAAAVRDRASAMTAGRQRKQKKKGRAELFDYLSDDSEDWDSPPAVAPKRRRSGKALDGKEDLLGQPSAPSDPDLLPAAKAKAAKLCPTNYQQALLHARRTGTSSPCSPLEVERLPWLCSSSTFGTTKSNFPHRPRVPKTPPVLPHQLGPARSSASQHPGAQLWDLFFPIWGQR